MSRKLSPPALVQSPKPVGPNASSVSEQSIRESGHWNIATPRWLFCTSLPVDAAAPLTASWSTDPSDAPVRTEVVPSFVRMLAPEHCIPLGNVTAHRPLASQVPVATSLVLRS